MTKEREHICFENMGRGNSGIFFWGRLKKWHKMLDKNAHSAWKGTTHNLILDLSINHSCCRLQIPANKCNLARHALVIEHSDFKSDPKTVRWRFLKGIMTDNLRIFYYDKVLFKMRSEIIKLEFCEVWKHLIFWKVKKHMCSVHTFSACVHDLRSAKMHQKIGQDKVHSVPK